VVDAQAEYLAGHVWRLGARPSPTMRSSGLSRRAARTRVAAASQRKQVRVM
jgi:hypothetical protein